MKTKFETLKNKIDKLTIQERENEVLNLVKEIIATDSSLLSVDKTLVSYGTWKSVGFANEYYFGKELSDMLVRALNGKITHDEDREFQVSDFEEEIFNEIFESI